MIKSKRLLKVLEFVDYIPVVADIGSDHGYFAEMLIESGKVVHVIATDISSASLDKTRLLIARHNLEEKIETRVGNGLLVIKQNEVGMAIIAGMGGHEIAKILGDKKRVDNTKLFILQPIQDTIDLRRWLCTNGYLIEKDECVEETGKFYDVIKVRKIMFRKYMSYNQIMFGKSNLEQKEFTKSFIGKLQYERNRYAKVLQNNALSEQRDRDLKKFIKRANKLLKKYE